MQEVKLIVRWRQNVLNSNYTTEISTEVYIKLTVRYITLDCRSK